VLIVLLKVMVKFETTVKALSEKLEQSHSEYILGNKYVNRNEIDLILMDMFLNDANSFFFSSLFSCSFTKADAQLYGHLYPILYAKIPEYQDLRNILLQQKALVDYVNNMDSDVQGSTLLV
jgi:hypothetical protein